MLRMRFSRLKISFVPKIVIVVVVVAVVVVNGVIQISSGGGGLSNPIDPAREAIEQAIRDCYRQIEILQALLQAAASSEEFQMIMDMNIAKWQESTTCFDSFGICCILDQEGCRMQLICGKS